MYILWRGDSMITKKVISVEESIEFFNTSINTLETAIGVCVIDIKNKRITYEQSALDIINDDKLFTGKEYPFSDEKLKFSLLNCGT